MIKIKFFVIYTFLIFLFGCWEKEIGRSYYPEGNIKSEASIKNGLLEGVSTMYYKNGNKMSEAIYKSGLLHGLSISYYENGEIKATAHYYNGLLHGKSSYWEKNGNLSKEVIFEFGKLTKIKDGRF